MENIKYALSFDLIDIFEEYTDSNGIKITNKDKENELIYQTSLGIYKNIEEAEKELQLANIYGEDYDMMERYILDFLDSHNEDKFTDSEIEEFSKGLIEVFTRIIPDDNLKKISDKDMSEFYSCIDFIFKRYKLKTKTDNQ